MGFFERLKEGLGKTRQNIANGLDELFGTYERIDEYFYEDLEEVLVLADVGADATKKIIRRMKEKVYEENIRDQAGAKNALIESLAESLRGIDTAEEDPDERKVLLVIGVNGVGKTTSIGKLAMNYKNQGKKVILAAADTFRAGAREQLEIWAERCGCDIIGHPEGADPAAVVYDAVSAFEGKQADILICDTAGRLHNKKNLMDELAKINRIFEKKLPGIRKEVLLVLDATTGQNALSQVREFKQVCDPDGIILTKMDGSAKGGIVIAIAEEFKIPVKYIGVGEHAEDLQKFSAEDFLKAIFFSEEDGQ